MATVSQQPVKPSALKDWRRFWQPLEHRTGCCDWAWKSPETQKATQEQYQPADKKILALTWDHYSIPLEWEPFKDRNYDRRKPTFCHWVIDHLPTLISPSFSHLLNILTAFRLQLVPLYQVIKRCFYMKTQQSKWDLGLYGSPICSALTFRPWCQALEGTAVLRHLSSGGRVSGLGRWVRQRAGNPLIAPGAGPPAAGAEQQTLVSQPVCEHVGFV